MEELNRSAADLDLSELRDEDLVALATDSGSHEAAVILLLRYRHWSTHLIMRLARHRGLTPDDTEDALQDAVFGILKAIARYDTLHFSRQSGCLFQTFLRRVLTNRFKDFVRHLWRYESHFGRTVALKEAAGRGERGPTWPLEDRESDPARLAERKELTARVHKAVANLEGVDSRLVDGLLCGVRLRAVAAELGISYDAAKRRWRRLRTHLAGRLGGLIS